MAANTEILAKLGIDTSKIPQDLGEARKYLAQFAKDAEQATGKKAGENAGGKFFKGFAGKLQGAGLGSVLGSALGINITDLSKKVAAAFQSAFGGGTAEAFEEAGKVADRVAEKQEKYFKDRLTTVQLITRLEKEIASAQEKANSIQGKERKDRTGRVTGRDDLTADQLKEQQIQTEKVIDATVELERIKKDEREATEEYNKKQREYDQSRLPKLAQIVNLNADILGIQKELEKSGLSQKEQAEKRTDILEKQKSIDDLRKEIADENLKAEKERTAELKKQAEVQEKLRKLAQDTAELRGEIAEKQFELGDRSKLTLGELASLPNQDSQLSLEAQQSERNRRRAFSSDIGSNLSTAQKRAMEEAQRIQDLESQAEQARLAGNKDKAETLLQDVGQRRQSLVESGFTKSTEGNPLREQVKEIKKLNADLTAKLTETNTLLTGKFANE